METEETRAQRVTSADVARASGVSRATVSYVLNDDPHQTIPPETRERVLKAAQQLGYRPNTPARILRTGHSPIVLAVLPFEQIDPNLAQALKELEASLAMRGFTLIWHVGLHLRTGKSHPSYNVTPGVILSYADETSPALSSFLQQFQAPILSMLGHSSVQQEVGKMQVSHLLQRGKRRLLFAASEREDVRVLTQNRLEGVRQGCAQWELEPPTVCVIPASRERARAIIHDLNLHQALPQGICCYNDEVAFAVLAALADEGIAVPDEIAVIGCDNIPLAQFSIPPLTTIQFEREQPLDMIVEMIVAASQGKAVTEMPQAIPMVVERRSA
ncbi:LacI family DNA-binding transcriptional regulator [Dictyobacter kobayashii]|uniref:LacI family transcriptional regulator n=1 Tax=Dictyobacter kobayashii TaxID=2014872 RepID=A0A402AT63_9CHLR|nr:LacI family DNA-binding transcriptional regulator [Dictyobacter kobayashii]GCE22287.1 LacI family transcriptional regulator [Dictyobacter kobayashii]